MITMSQAAEDDVIPLDVELPGTQADHVYVKKGTDVWIPVRDGVNVDKAIWGSDAAEFKPERWLSGDLPDSVRAIKAQGNVLTFGDGYGLFLRWNSPLEMLKPFTDRPKTCLGRTFGVFPLNSGVPDRIWSDGLAPTAIAEIKAGI